MTFDKYCRFSKEKELDNIQLACNDIVFFASIANDCSIKTL